MFNVLLEKYINLRHWKGASNIIITEHKIKFKLHILMRSNDDQTNTPLPLEKYLTNEIKHHSKPKPKPFCTVQFFFSSHEYSELPRANSPIQD